MADKTSIEWTDSSWSPIRARNLTTGKIGWHCEHATTGCEFCYAEGMNKRLGTGLPFKPGHRKDIEIFLDEKMLLAPLRWRKPRMIFVCSMTDLFADFVSDEWIDKIFAIMALCPQHTFQVLTKRADRMREYLTRHDVGGRWGMEVRGHMVSVAPGTAVAWTRYGLPNVWLGVSCERQQEADERIPLLRETPAAFRFISFEPLLGHIEPDLRGIHWAIAGGESGPGARPMHPKWPRRLRNICAERAVAFFFKQWGQYVGGARDAKGWHYYENRSYSPNSDHDFGDGLVALNVGKKAAGRLLGGIEHNEFPKVSA